MIVISFPKTGDSRVQRGENESVELRLQFLGNWKFNYGLLSNIILLINSKIIV